MDNVETKYGYARFVLLVEDIIGTIMWALGAFFFFFALMAFLQALGDQNSGGISLGALAVLLPSFGLMLAGFLIVAQSQLVRASLDSADCNREMLMLMRQQDPNS